jgi:hypothetical protein
MDVRNINPMPIPNASGVGLIRTSPPTIENGMYIVLWMKYNLYIV